MGKVLYAAVTAMLFILIVVIGKFAQNSSMRSSVVLLALVLHTVLYAIIMAVVLAFGKLLNKKSVIEEDEYTSQF